jgi:hypothetical protein
MLVGKEGYIVYEAQNVSVSLCVGQWLAPVALDPFLPGL